MSMKITKPLNTIVAPSHVIFGCWGTIADWLEDISSASDGTLVGVDIFHEKGFDWPDEATLCVGYVARSGEFQATFEKISQEGGKICRLFEKWVSDSRVLPGEVFEVLNRDASELSLDDDDCLEGVHTLVTRSFTIAYTYDRTLPFEVSAPTVCATLVLHERADAATAPSILRNLNTCLAELTSVHYVLKGVRFQVPTLSEILAAT